MGNTFGKSQERPKIPQSWEKASTIQTGGPDGESPRRVSTLNHKFLLQSYLKSQNVHREENTDLLRSIVIVFKYKESKRLKFIRSRQTIWKSRTKLLYLGKHVFHICPCLHDPHMGQEWQIVCFPKNAILVILKLLCDISYYCLCGNLKYDLTRFPSVRWALVT